jgi:hypothetical protein
MAYRKKPHDEKIAHLEAQRDQINAKLRREKARARQDERKRDTRRKIIAGALALEHKDPAFRDQMKRLIGQYVTRPEDRALFGLEPLSEGSPGECHTSSSDHRSTGTGIRNYTPSS